MIPVQRVIQATEHRKERTQPILLNLDHVRYLSPSEDGKRTLVQWAVPDTAGMWLDLPFNEVKNLIRLGRVT